MTKYNKINSFSQSPSAPQIISYLIYILSVLLYIFVIQNYYTNSGFRIAANIVYGLLASLQFFSSLLVSLSDPSDDIMISCKKQEFDLKEIDQLLYCQVCFAYVKKKSKHCRRCNRCVQDFDHHCIWINNCIGGKNYKIFFVMISSSFLSFLSFLVFMIMLWGEKNYDNYFFQMVFVWIFSPVVLILDVLIFVLVIFHIYLICSQITTFQHFQGGKQDGNVNHTQNTLNDSNSEIEHQKNIGKEKLQKIDERTAQRHRGNSIGRREHLKKKMLSNIMQLAIQQPQSKQRRSETAKDKKSTQLNNLYKTKSER